MEQRVKRSRYDYTESFKLMVVRRIERGELSCGQALLCYGIQGTGTVRRWMRKHGAANWREASLRLKLTEMPMARKPQGVTLEQQRIKQLEAQLKEATQKASLFEAVVHVMKRDYGITVKKPLGKSLRKSSSKD